MKKFFTLSTLFLFFIFPTVFSQTSTPPSAGDGSASNPYQIATLDNLYWLSQTSSEWDKNFIQTADIDALTTSGWDGGNGFSPIGNPTTPFTGKYHGQGHLIKSLTIDRSGDSRVGLFGYTENALIDSLGLTDVELTGSEYVGSIAGFSRNSDISYCFCSGHIDGGGSLGGITGNCSGTTVSNCYSKAEVSGTGMYIGGLVGNNIYSALVEKCYSTGKVTGGSDVGGLVGRTAGGAVVNSFWDTETSAQAISAGGQGMTTAGMKDYHTYTDTSFTEELSDAWDFSGNISDDTENNDYWGIGAGNDHYPVLTWQSSGDSLYALLSSDNITAITNTTATGNGTIVFLGSSDPTAYGFCWNTTGQPTVSDSKTDEGTTHTTGTFSSTMTGLSTGSTYYARAYVTNVFGTYYGKTLQFTAGVPLVSTDSVVVITDSTATGFGNIFELGGSNPTAHGFCWNTTGDPTISDHVSNEGAASSTGAFSTTITGLTVGQTYYAKAYVTNTNGTTYGDEIMFVMALPPKGNGTENNPYRIATPGNLYWLSQNPSVWDKYFIQTRDINIAASSEWDEGKGFSSIGDSTKIFTGVYHGQGHTIDSLYINTTSGIFTGLFGRMDYAIVDSLGVTHARVFSDNYSSSCFIAVSNYSSITQCYSTGEVHGAAVTGGLVGMLYESHLSGCYSEVVVNGSGDYAGGLVGYSEHSSTIRNSYSTGKVTNTGENTGGLTGESRHYSIIENCYSTGDVSGGDGNTGGLTGNNNGSVIRNCYSTGDVTGTGSTGGLIGHIFNTSEVNDCYSNGHVSGSTNTGGMIGLDDTGNSTITNSFWDTQSSGFSTSAGGTGKTTEEMKDLQTYTDTTTAGLTAAWDFAGTPNDDHNTEDIWTFGGTEGYPVFTTADTVYSLITTDSITDVENTSVKAFGTIQFLSPSAPSTYGFCWNTTGDPDVSGSKTVQGPATGTGSFESAITGLQTGTRYYARAYITNAYGTVYGKEVSFIPGTATVLTVKVSHITDSSALAEGNITMLGGANPTAYGFCWNTTGDPDITDQKSDEGSISTTGTFTTRITGLSPNGIYYARAYVTNTYGTTYGKVIKFQKAPTPAGSGTEADPYRIETLGNLRWLMEHPDKWDKYFIQTADIDASETDSWDGGKGFSPIGHSYTTAFSGHYNGKGHTIQGVYIDRPDDVFTGLFGYLKNGSVLDSLHLTGVRVTGKENTGGLIGFGYYTTVTHCSSEGEIQGNGENTGGLIGGINYSTVNLCYSRGNVTSSSDKTGGLIGNNFHTHTSRSFFEGDVSGHSETGGLTGHNNGNLDNCYSRGHVSGTAYYTGGVSGENRGSIRNCYSRSSITGNTYVGGFAGDNDNGVIDRCYSTGTVAGNGSVGGLTGIGTAASSSFWDTLSSGTAVSAAGTPKSTVELKNYRTFTDLHTAGLDSTWDFSGHFFDDTATADIWSLGSGNDGYLSLSWEDSLFTIVSADSIGDVAATSATAHGTVITTGSDTAEAHGFCWNTTGHPDLSGAHNNAGLVTATGPYAAAVSGLTAGEIYYIRAYATNVFGTFYGDEVTLLAGGALVVSDSITNITAHTALGHGNITDLGASDPTAYGFCWNTAGEPDLSDAHSDEGALHTTGTFTTVITGLFPGTIYHARAYVTNSYGTYYGKEIRFVYAPAPEGAGTDTDPYRIRNLGNLRWMVQHPEHWDKVYIQTEDINAASTAGWDADSGFIPLGNTRYIFTGKYHGKGHTLDSLTISRPGTDNIGFFGYTGNAVIDSLGLTNVSVTGNANTGALAGHTDNTTISYCYVTGEVTGNGQSGGLVGWNNASSVISYCYARGNVHGTNLGGNTGGLVGYNYNATIRYSCSYSSVHGSNAYYSNIGGFVGNNRSSTISDCYALGDVTGNAHVGGFVGSNNNAAVINNCYSTGKVTAGYPQLAGGFSGDNFKSSTINNSFWDVDSSGIETSAGGTGKTTEEMKNFKTFTDTSSTGLEEAWDFVGTFYDDIATEDIWGFRANNHGYPALTWQDSVLAIISSDSLTDITPTSLKGRGNILYLSPATVTAHGYCWSTSDNPDITDNKSDEGVANTTGPFTTDITGLTEGQTYFLRAYATNTYGTCYGKIFSITAGGGFITTDSIAHITDTTVTGYGNIKALGASHPTAYGFCWNTTGQPDITDPHSDEGSTDHTGMFSTLMRGLQTGDRYYFRAYVTNASGTSYGDEIMIVLVIPPQGSGTSDDPYQIHSLGNLRWLSQHPEAWNKYFIQTNDIDARTTATWNDGTGFSPIGNSEIPFHGTYHGQGHIISGITIHLPNTDNVGFFGNISGGHIDNLGLVDASVTGQNSTGILAGYLSQSSNVSRCFTTGNINSTGNHAGGLAGYCYDHVTLDNCYSMANVNATGNNVGGLAGWNRNNSTVRYCYSTGRVTAGGTTTGGLIGNSEWSPTVINSFWDMQTSGMSTSSGGKGKTTEEMKDPATFTDITTAGLDHAWDLMGHIHDDTGDEDIWGYRSGNNGYLCLSWQDSLYAMVSTGQVDITTESSVTLHGQVLYTGTPTPTAHGFCWNTTGYPTVSDNKTDEGAANTPGPYSSDISGLSAGTIYYVRAYITNTYGTYYGNSILFSTSEPAGSGTEADPYRITCLGDLLWLTQHTDAWDKYFIQTADIVAATTKHWNTGKGLRPVGNNTVNFTGHYHGKGHIIDSLFINRPESDNVGLFGYLSNASIDSLGLTSANITGSNNTAALAGNAIQTNLYACFTTGQINGNSAIGGVAGSCTNATVSNCYSRTGVAGGNLTGGLVGSNWGSQIDHTYSTGKITSPGNNTGGLVGYTNANYFISQSFWDTITAGTANGAGFGKSTSEMTTPCIYIDGTEASWDFMDETDNGTDDLWGMNAAVNDGYPFLSWQAYTNTEICCNIDTSVTRDGITLTANATGDVTYQWLDCNNGYAIIDGETNRSFTATANGSYAVVITSSICSDTSSCHAITTVGINDPVQGTWLRLYPNPASDHVFVECSGMEIRRIEILDFTGRMILQIRLNGQQETIDMSDKPTGIYLVKLFTNKGIIFRKVIKK